MVGFYKTLKPDDAIAMLKETADTLRRRHNNLKPDFFCKFDLEDYVHCHIHQGLTMRSTHNPEHDAAQFKQDLLEFFDKHVPSQKTTVISIIEDQTTRVIDRAHQAAFDFNELLLYKDKNKIPKYLYSAEYNYHKTNLIQFLKAYNSSVSHIICRKGCAKEYIDFMQEKDPEFKDFMYFYAQELKPIRINIKNQLFKCVDQIDSVIDEAEKYKKAHTNHDNQHVFAQTMTELALHYQKINDAFSLINDGSSAISTDVRSDFNDYAGMKAGYVKKLVTPDFTSGIKYVPPSPYVCARIAGLRNPSPAECTLTLNGNLIFRAYTRVGLFLKTHLMERYRGISPDYTLYPSFQEALERVRSEGGRPLARMMSALRGHTIM